MKTIYRKFVFDNNFDYILLLRVLLLLCEILFQRNFTVNKILKLLISLVCYLPAWVFAEKSHLILYLINFVLIYVNPNS